MYKKQLAGYFAAILCILIWGTTFISTKVLLRTFAPIEVLAMRLTIAILGLFLLYPKRLKFLGLRREGILALAGFCGVSLYFFMENTALTLSTASNVGILVTVSPFFTALFSLKSQEKPGIAFFIGFASAITGIALIALNGQSLHLNPIGDFLAVGAAFVWSCYSILTRDISSWGISVIPITRRIFIYGLLGLLPILSFLGFHITTAQICQPINLANLLYLGLCASAICFVSWNFAVSRLGAVKTSVNIYLIPVVTTVTAVLILHETISWFTLCGMLLILFGLALSSKRRKDV